MAKDGGGKEESGSLADRIWLDVPYTQKDLAKAAGAKWDTTAKRWYAPESGMVDLEPWIRGSDPTPKARFVQVAGKVWLDVPFGDNDAAKAAGARWDVKAKCWYAPRPGMPELERWAPGPPLGELPLVLPGENREFGQGLFVDLVPSSCWFTNVRSCVPKPEWDRIRRMVYKRANHECEICGDAPAIGNYLRLDAHERWSYDSAAGVQKLERLICLCPDCHTATHYGMAQVRNVEHVAVNQLAKVNGWSIAEIDEHVEAAFALWRERSERNWRLDLSLLEDLDIQIRQPPEPDKRATIASERLSHQGSRAGISEMDVNLIPKEFRVQL